MAKLLTEKNVRESKEKKNKREAWVFSGLSLIW
jgi:hypothetical protein